MSAVPPRFTLDKSSRELVLRFGDEAHSLGAYPPKTPGDTIVLWQRIFERGVAAGIEQTSAPAAGPYSRDGANIVRSTGACIATARDIRVAMLIIRLLNDFAAKWPAEEREHVASTGGAP
jgi:hypothetical protein